MGRKLEWIDEEAGGSLLYDGDMLVAVVEIEGDCYRWYTKKIWGLSPSHSGSHDTLAGAKSRAREAWIQANS